MLGNKVETLFVGARKNRVAVSIEQHLVVIVGIYRLLGRFCLRSLFLGILQSLSLLGCKLLGCCQSLCLFVGQSLQFVGLRLGCLSLVLRLLQVGKHRLCLLFGCSRTLERALVETVGCTYIYVKTMETVALDGGNGTILRIGQQIFQRQVDADCFAYVEAVLPTEVADKLYGTIFFVVQCAATDTCTEEENRIPDAVVFVAANPIGQIHHKVGVEENVRPIALTTGSGGVSKFAAFAYKSYTEYGVEPFAYANVCSGKYRIGDTAAVTHVEGRAYTGLNLPVIPETVGDEAFDIGTLLLPVVVCRHCAAGNQECRCKDENKILFHNWACLLYL